MKCTNCGAPLRLAMAVCVYCDAPVVRPHVNHALYERPPPTTIPSGGVPSKR